MYRQGRRLRSTAALLTVGFVALACADDGPATDGPAGSDDDEQAYYEGRTIEFIVPYSPGGGTDLLARLIAERLPEYVPGEPNIQVVNVEGGGGIVGSNQFARAAPDGETLLLTSSPVMFNQFIGNDLVEYDFREWVPITAHPSGGVYWARPDAGYDVTDPTTVAELRGQSGTTDFVSAAGTIFYVLTELGADIDVVSGYEGTGATVVAWEQGELDIAGTGVGPYLESVESFVESGEAIPILVPGVIDGDDLVRDSRLPDIPSTQEVWEAVNGDTEGEEWETWRQLHAVSYGMQKGLFLTPGSPEEASSALREGMQALIDSDGFEDLLFDLVGDPLPVVGEEAEEVFALLDVDDRSLELWLTHLRERYGYDG